MQAEAAAAEAEAAAEVEAEAAEAARLSMLPAQSEAARRPSWHDSWMGDAGELSGQGGSPTIGRDAARWN